MEWARLAQAIVDRRVELGFRTREAFATAKGLSSRLMGDLERMRRDNYDGATFARLEQALEWPAGRVRQILRETEPERLSIDQATGAMLDTTGRELIPELYDLIRFMRPDSNLDKEGREAARKILYGVVMTLAQLAAQTSEVRRLTGVPEPDFDPGDVEIPDQPPPHPDRVESPADVVLPRAARESARRA